MMNDPEGAIFAYVFAIGWETCTHYKESNGCNSPTPRLFMKEQLNYDTSEGKHADFGLLGYNSEDFQNFNLLILKDENLKFLKNCLFHV